MGLIWSSAAVLVVLALVGLMIRRRRLDETGVQPADAPARAEAW
jgi:hypothetical protein